jgi:hypothetical protein
VFYFYGGPVSMGRGVGRMGGIFYYRLGAFVVFADAALSV